MTSACGCVECFVFHKVPGNACLAGGADEVTLLLGPIMVASLQSAATIGGEDCRTGTAFGKSVEMATERSLQIELAKAIKQRIRVDRPISHICSKRKVSEKHRGRSLVEPWQIIV